MSFENCKIENYTTGISSLPDYPSEAGYTAENLKALFDARSDGEIKEKHNELVDAVVEKAAELETTVTESEARAKEYAESLGANYDPAGSATEAETRAKEYADSLAENYDTKGSAESAKAEAIAEAKVYAESLGANYDPAGSATEAETRAKEYADSAIALAISSIINLDEVAF